MRIQINLENREQRHVIENMIHAVINAADPEKAVKSKLLRNGDELLVEDIKYRLGDYRHVYIVGFGKASQLMLKGVVDVVGDKITSGLVITKHIDSTIQQTMPDKILIVEGSHPVPDEKSLASTKMLSKILNDSKQDDLIICLISGGGSSLLTYPVEGVTLFELQHITRQLLECGAEINEINTLRKHLDRVKGGGVAKMAYPAHMLTLILSDVVGNPLDVIASGPTVVDATTFADGMNILKKYNLEKSIPKNILTVFENGVKNEKQDQSKFGGEYFENVHNVLVASNYLAAMAAVNTARESGFQSNLLTTYMQGEARHIGRMLAGILRQIDQTGHPISRPACLIVGGETTVQIIGQGLGGRNLEAALAAVEELNGIDNVVLVTLATDGEDGPTNAAGAWVSGETHRRSIEAGLNVNDFLNDNNSYHFFVQLNGLIITGPTGTNVNDLAFLFAF